MKLLKVLVAVLACTGLLFAQAAEPATSTTTTTTTSKTKKEVTTVVKGTVVSVDAIANSIVVKTKKGEETISVEAGAKIKSGKADLALGDIKADSKVAVSCKMIDGKQVATQIVVAPAGSVKASKTTKKTTESSISTTTTEPAAAPAAK
jgi:hypothetical protein